MTEVKHTPGPWSFSFESSSCEWAIVTDSNGNIVANVNSETGPDLPPLVSIKMPQTANARIIAAAPEMLEALGGLIRIIDAMKMSTGLGKNQTERLEKARSLVARVKIDN